jgi:ABC-2 type transport system permease protein
MLTVLRKELRGMLRERRGFLVPAAYQAILLLVFGLMLSGVWAGGAQGLPGQSVGEQLASVWVFLQGTAVLLAAPVVGSAMVAGERERGTWARLLSSPVDRRGLVLAKWLAGSAYVWLLLACSLPVIAAGHALGGVDGAAIAGILLSQALVASALVALGLALSTFFHRAWMASLSALGAVFALVALTLVSMSLTHHTRAAAEELPLALNPMCAPLLAVSAFPSSHAMWCIHLSCMVGLAWAALGVAMFRVGRATD